MYKAHLRPEDPGTGYQREDPSEEPSHPPSPADPASKDSQHDKTQVSFLLNIKRFIKTNYIQFVFPLVKRRC